MGEDWLTQILSDRWFPAIVTYCLGLLTGWLIWSGGQTADGGENAADENGHLEIDTIAGDKQQPPVSNGNGNGNGADAPDSLKLGALEAELNKAKTMLTENEEDNAAFTDLLSNLDDAVKRANGRLKLILKSVKRAKD